MAKKKYSRKEALKTDIDLENEFLEAANKLRGAVALKGAIQFLIVLLLTP